MHRLIGLALLLSACTVDEAGAPSGFRDPAVTIASSSRFDPARFVGEWTVVADYTPESHCAPKLRFDPGPTPDTLTYHYCTERIDLPRLNLAYDPGGTVWQVEEHGRLAPDEGPQMWVLWVAEDYGTAVLGTPSGSFGRILNRGAQIRPDRLEAAREVLAFNGYDLSRLVDTRP